MTTPDDIPADLVAAMLDADQHPEQRRPRPQTTTTEEARIWSIVNDLPGFTLTINGELVRVAAVEPDVTGTTQHPVRLRTTTSTVAYDEAAVIVLCRALGYEPRNVTQIVIRRDGITVTTLDPA